MWASNGMYLSEIDMQMRVISHGELKEGFARFVDYVDYAA